MRNIVLQTRRNSIERASDILRKMLQYEKDEENRKWIENELLKVPQLLKELDVEIFKNFEEEQKT